MFFKKRAKPQPPILHATDEDFAELVEGNSGLSIVDFWAPWCGPCRQLSPALERVAGEFAGRAQLVKVNIDENPDVAARFGVRSIPMVVGFRDGRAASQFVGAQPEPAVRRFFDALLPKETDRLAEQGARMLGAHDLAGARAQFEAALDVDPQHQRSAIMLAATLLELGELDGAAALARRYPADATAKRVLARVGLIRVAADATRDALEARLAANASDAEAHYRLGALHALAAEWEPALDHLLEAVLLDRKLDDDGARLRMLDIFGLLGDANDITREYRQRLANVLF